MNSLAHLEEFKKILADYHVSPRSQKILEKTELVLLAAPSAVGRNTIVRELLKTNEYYFVVSDTTRKPRINDGVPEQNGVEYWFRPEDEVLKDLENGKFLEAAIIHNQQVSGISIRELEKASQQGKVATTDIEIVGVHNIIMAKPDTKAIFVLPPSFEEWQRRMKERGEMTPEEYKRRLESAEKEFAAAIQHKYYKFVINDNIQSAVEQIHQIAKLNAYDSEQQKMGRNLAEQLYVQTKTFLAEQPKR